MRTTHLKTLTAALAVATLSACSGTGGGLVASNDTGATPTTPTTPVIPSVKSEGYIAGSNYDVTIDGKTYKEGAGTNILDYADFSQGSVIDVDYVVQSNATSATTFDAKGTLRLYNQQYSVISMLTVTEVNNSSPGADDAEVAIQGIVGTQRLMHSLGQRTAYDNLPAGGTYTYTGKAFTSSETGDLSLDVFFGTASPVSRTIGVSGSITGLTEYGTITLASDSYDYAPNNDIVQLLSQNITAANPGFTFSGHQMKIYGPNGEEVTGNFSVNNGTTLQGIYYGGAR